MDSSAWMNEIVIQNPEVSIADEWGDFHGWKGCDAAGAGVLPPVRRKTRLAGGEPEEPLSASFPVALKIEPTWRKSSSGSTVESKLEVVHFNPTVIKLEVDESLPAKVPRVETFHPLPVITRGEMLERRLDREVSGEWGRNTGIAMKWMVAAAVGVVAVVVLAMVLLPLVQPTETVRKRVVYTTVNETPLPEDRAGQMDMLRREEEAIGLFRRFASATTHDDLLSTVRHREETAVWVKRRPPAPWLPSRWQPAQPCGWVCYIESGRVCGILSGVLPDFSPFTAFMTMEHGVMLLDWKATTGFCSADFAQLEQGIGDACEIRGYLKPSNFYTAAFPEQNYRSYVLLAPDRERSVWVYTDRSGMAESLLSASFVGGEIVAPDSQPRRFTVALSRPATENAAPNQWLLKEVLHKQWIRP